MAKNKKRSDVDRINKIRETITKSITQLSGEFVAREEAIAAIWLALLTRHHFIFVGPAGVAKTALVRGAMKHIVGVNYFQALMGSFTQPDDIFGPVDLQAYQKGEWKRSTANMLPEAHVAMLDECMKGGDGIVNTLLTVFNERQFAGEDIPLMTIGAATNWPEIEMRSEKVAAFYDRFLFRVIVDKVEGSKDRLKMLKAGRKLRSAPYEPVETITLEELKEAGDDVERIKISDHIMKLLDEVQDRIAPKRKKSGHGVESGINISDRRLIQLQSALQASAWLDGRTEVTIEDFAVLQFGMWEDKDDWKTIQSVLSTLDAKAVKRMIELIDHGRSVYADLVRSGFGPSATNDAVEEIKGLVVKVNEEMAQPVFTKAGRKNVGKAMLDLKGDFTTLCKKAKSFASAGTGAK